MGTQQKNKRLQQIDTYHFFEGDITLGGVDENGDSFSVTLCAYDVIHWIDTDGIRDDLIKYINQGKNKQSL